MGSRECPSRRIGFGGQQPRVRARKRVHGMEVMCIFVSEGYRLSLSLCRRGFLILSNSCKPLLHRLK
jgi:hypothetical protein